jgi:coenzyme F420-reducing hydrogenase gamma subunit
MLKLGSSIGKSSVFGAELLLLALDSCCGCIHSLLALDQGLLLLLQDLASSMTQKNTVLT